MQADFLLDVNFSNSRIGGAVIFSGAQFGGIVSFSNMRVSDNVTFIGAHFAGDAHFVAVQIDGDATFSGMVLEGKLIIDGSNFRKDLTFGGDSETKSVTCGGDVSFRAAHVGGVATFLGTEFRGAASFHRATFEHGALFRSDDQGNGVVFAARSDFSHARIHGPAEFRSVKFCGEMLLIDALISGAATFSGAQFKGAARCHRCRFGSSVFFRPDDQGKGVVFTEGADFSRTRVEGSAEFQGALFEGPANFSRSTIAGNAIFGSDGQGTPVVFAAMANFSGARIEGRADFAGAQLRGNAIFANTRFEDIASFSGVRIQGHSDFMDVHCAGDLYFNKGDQNCSVIFQGNVAFTDAVIGGIANFSGSRFSGETGFERAEFGSDVFFQPDPPNNPVVFEKTTQFTGCRFSANAHFQNVRFSGPISFSAVEAVHELHYENALFAKNVNFREARFAIVHFRPIVIAPPWWLWRLIQRLTCFVRDTWRCVRRRIPLNVPARQFNGLIDMRGLSYERVYVEWKPFLGALNPYDRQPYSEMETAFRRMGEDRGADDVYHARRIREMRIRWSWRRPAQWIRLGFEGLHWLISGFGVRPARLLLLIGGFFGIGWMLYAKEGAVVSRDATGRPLPASAPVDLDKFHAFWVSLDQLLPSPVEVVSGRDWAPSSNTFREVGGVMVSYADFATIQSLVGWILVPIGILILSGVLRRTS